VLGFAEFPPYLTRSPWFGATAGRCANRIRDGHLELDGARFQLDRNFRGKHHLHGGTDAIGKRLWNIVEMTENSVSLAISLAAGEMGYPGAMQVRQRISLRPRGVLDIRLQAETDAPTLCNLAHHSYFNLDGSQSVASHLLWVDADAYLPVDGDLIPTGKLCPVAATAFDFRQPAPVAGAIAAGGVDHNFCLSRTRMALRTVARLQSPASGLTMEVRTTEPGLQVYDGAKLDIDLPGLAGKPMRANSGIALEPQVWPDANHHADFPQAVLRSGERYDQHTQYVFAKEE